MKLLCACKHSRENVTPEHSWMCFKYFWQNMKFSTKDFTQYFSRSLSWTRDMTFSIASWWFTSGFLPTHQSERMEKSPWKPGGNLPPNCRREQLRYPRAAAAFDGRSTSCAALNTCADLWAPWLPCTSPTQHIPPSLRLPVPVSLLQPCEHNLPVAWGKSRRTPLHT